MIATRDTRLYRPSRLGSRVTCALVDLELFEWFFKSLVGIDLQGHLARPMRATSRRARPAILHRGHT